MYEDRADILYDAIRANPNDVGEIAENTGLRVENVAKVKTHLFLELHYLDKYEPIGVPGHWSRFDSDPVIAESWERLRAGNFGRRDLQLLRHEIAEAWFMRRNGPSYRLAHEAAEIRFPAPLELWC